VTAHVHSEGIVVGRGFFFGSGRYIKKAGQEKAAAKKVSFVVLCELV
jgi:hypothetical protein